MTVEDVLADWQRPSYDITASTIGVFDGDRLVAYGDFSDTDVAYAAVLPSYQGRGLGTAIARWLQATARAAGSTRIGTQVPEGSAADRLMRDLGYEVRWTAWDLELPPDREISARPLNDGFAIRDAEESDRGSGPGRSSRTASWSGPSGTGCRWPTSVRGSGTVPATSPGTCAC